MSQQIKRIITHEDPHLDEIAALWLILRFGKEKFPGAENVFVELVDNNAQITPEKGLLALGVGGGMFDEHPKPNKARKSDECTATLIAKYIGLDTDDENIVRILNFVKNADLKASGGTFDLAQMIKILHALRMPTEDVIAWTFMALDVKMDDPRESGDFSLQYIAFLLREMNPNEPEIAYEWFKIGMEAKLADQTKFFADTYREFHNNANVEEIKSFKRTLTLVSIRSDNDQIAKIARSKKHGVDADIVVQINSCGNMGIYTNQKHGKINLESLVRMLNAEEQRMRKDIHTTDWDTLSAEGMIPNGFWYYHVQGQFVLNGSKTAHVEPTKIPFERIVELVKIAMYPQDEMEKHCDLKTCVSSRKKPCPLYAFGLGSCRKVRYESKYKK